MLVSFLLTLLSVAHIFEIPFMVFDPKSFAKTNNTIPQQQCNSTITLEGGNGTAATAWETQAVAVNASKPSAKPAIMNRIMKDDIGYFREDGTLVPFEGVNR